MRQRPIPGQTSSPLDSAQWTWGESSPFYQGDSWTDYIQEGGLVREVDADSTWQALRAFLLNQPSGSLFVPGAQSAIAQIPRSYYSGSNTDFPGGFYKKNTRIRIIKPDYDNDTLTRYSFRLVPISKVLSEDYEFLTPGLLGEVEEFIDYLESVIPGGFLDLINLDELGAWELTVSESTPLRPLSTRQRGALDGLDLDNVDDEEKISPSNLLPWLVSGAGLVTGNPLLIGAGFAWRFIQGSQK